MDLVTPFRLKEAGQTLEKTSPTEHQAQGRAEDVILTTQFPSLTNRPNLQGQENTFCDEHLK